MALQHHYVCAIQLRKHSRTDTQEQQKLHYMRSTGVSTGGGGHTKSRHTSQSNEREDNKTRPAYRHQHTALDPFVAPSCTSLVEALHTENQNSMQQISPSIWTPAHGAAPLVALSFTVVPHGGFTVHAHTEAAVATTAIVSVAASRLCTTSCCSPVGLDSLHRGCIASTHTRGCNGNSGGVAALYYLLLQPSGAVYSGCSGSKRIQNRSMGAGWALSKHRCMRDDELICASRTT